MKNLDPRSGQRQLVTGKMYLPRRKIFEYLKRGVIAPHLLGYFFIALISADWHPSEYRYGLIRHEISTLAKLWGTAPSTMAENFMKLQVFGLLTKKEGVLQIVDFDDYQTSGGEYSNKSKVSDVQLEQIFGKATALSDNPDSSSLIPERKSEISETNSITATSRFKIPFKDSVNEDVEEVSAQPVSAQTDYEQICGDGDYRLLLPEDMEWIEKNYGANGSNIP